MSVADSKGVASAANAGCAAGVRAPRVIVAGTGTGTGKTVVACGLARALCRRGLTVGVAKCGPDYLDPTLLAAAARTSPANLDLHLADTAFVRGLVAHRAAASDVTLIEGVMGLFDGIGVTDAASTADVADVTETPVVLVVDARSRALSLAAELLGHLMLRTPTHVRAVILNRTSKARYPALREMLERECGVDVCGFVPQTEAAAFESRHLGLVCASELSDLDGRLDALADVLEDTLEVDRILELAASAPPLAAASRTPSCAPTGTRGPKIAVASDEAFCFCYPETLDALRSLGCDLAAFSPIHDEALPTGASGLLLPGGYPELHAASLEANESMRRAVLDAIEDGMPTVAECGGYLYLLESLSDPSGAAHEMVGALPGRARRGRGLAHFGYVTLAPREDTLLAGRGQRLAAHEFHHWQTDVEGTGLDVVRARDGAGWRAGFVSETLYAAFPHLYLASDMRAATRLVDACLSYAASHGLPTRDSEAGGSHA